MTIVTPRQLQQALLAMNVASLEPIQPLEVFGSASARTHYILPIVALLRVLTRPLDSGDRHGLPKPNPVPRGGLGSYMKAFNSALRLVLSSQTTSIVIEGEKAKVVKADGMNNHIRIDGLKKTVAANLVRTLRSIGHRY